MSVTLKSPQEQQKMREAGRLAAEVLDLIGEHVKPGVTTDELDRICHEHITRVQQATPANLNYRGFPKTICASVNHVVCHGIPGDKKVKDGDIVNIDVTVIRDGFHGDTSRMYFVGKPAPLAQRLVDVTFEAMWLEPDGKTRTPALGPEVAAHHLHVSTTERAKLIGLAAYARKAHFHYQQDSGAYTLESLVEIPNFLRTVLPAWRKLFAVDLDDKSANLLKGTRSVEIEAVAEKTPANGTRFGTGGTGLNLRWIFRAGERMLTESEVKALVRRGGQPVIVPSLGIVSLSPEKWESYRSWQDNVRETRPGGAIEGEPLSPYLVFSLFNDARLRLTLSPEIEAWRKQVLGAPPAPPELPALLRPYQRRGVEWMHHLCDVGCHGLLADEMGLGKTLQVLSLLAVRPAADRPSLIVCPASVVPVWREEIARFFPHLRVDTLKSGHDFARHREP
ncbi:MAG: M24 family metallopeptidase, partial [Gammaproteobacteria bacterium]|nr:M24 family metallopeptidase [Gammaproteobacteria bacterium]